MNLRSSLVLIALALPSNLAFPKQVKSSCPIVEPMENLDFDAISGQWFAQRSIGTEFVPTGTGCITSDYHFKDGKVLFDFRSTSKSGQLEQECGNAVPAANTTADWTLNFESGNVGRSVIFSTNYVDYVASYTCEENGDGTLKESGYVLTREPEGAQAMINYVVQMFIDRGVDVTNLVYVRQFDCDYQRPSNC
ncbi:hypothetical protein TCAL_13315 [Tigriopus californicus]|uniref:Lipocalin/cytosolic fatty-acid binding domain-containing protein n=1 Tax=Tigriopus californicus TaxID=6832 RepID=A0A553P609_TIGCA|nr:uncharacterized protein LOC131877427 [Tigriopus californicus]TRY73102.1 hypothetical protein TCAL_13315 [Tigriopus californicus]|eukprot:TCALIF_13315-PA protein Name:"Protein of unknown function" AED:0.00 eAED:0.00 QI:40/1/1/1/1/1/3/61/192